MKTLVILHGWQSSKEKWQKVKEGIEKSGVKVIVPDIPGFKPENELEKPWNLNDYVNWLGKFVQEKERSGELTEPFFLLGHSFGGAIATKYTLENPGLVEGLLLVSAACVRKKTLKRKALAYFSKIVKKFYFLPFYPLFRRAVYKFVIRNSDYPQARGFLEDTYLNVIKEDLSPVLNGITKPAILIWGDRDKATPLRDGLFIHSQINGSGIEIVRGAGHKLNTEAPDEIVKIVVDSIK